MTNPFSLDQMELIARLLNKRGFVIDEDISSLPCRYTSFGSTVLELESDLRERGYSGGTLLSWSTCFRGPPPAYGCVDTDSAPGDELIDVYCAITNGIGLECCSLTPDRLGRLMLGVEFACAECEHSSKMQTEEMPPFMRRISIARLRGRCTRCGARNVAPASAWRTFAPV